MANNIVYEEPTTLTLVCSEPAAPDAGDPVRFGNLTGIAVDDENAAGETVVKIGTFVCDVSVDDDVGGGIAVGDLLYYDSATDAIDNDSGGYFFGFALEVVGVGLTATINVLHQPSPAAGALGAGSIGATQLASNAVTTAKILAANVTGAKLAAGIVKRSLAAGTAAATNVTVAGMAVGDELVSVLSFTTAAAIASVADRTAEYVVGAGVLTKAAGTDETGNQLDIVYLDKT